MKQSDISEKTEQILALNDDSEKIHEFMCACVNAKSITENKLTAEALKITITAHMKNFINNLGKQ